MGLFDPQVGKSPWRRKWQLTPVDLPGKSHGQRSLVGCSPLGRQESDTTERLHFHFSLSYIGEGNGSPLQCSCLENPRDRGAWWAAVCEVAQSRTQLNQLSSSSNLNFILLCGPGSILTSPTSRRKKTGGLSCFVGWGRIHNPDLPILLNI